MVHVISLARYAAGRTRDWAATATTTTISERVRLKAECERLRQTTALMLEEISISAGVFKP